MTGEALQMIYDRAESVDGFTDVVYGLQRLCESETSEMISKRRSALNDLRAQAEDVVKNGQDPTEVMKLLDSVKAFIGDEQMELDRKEKAAKEKTGGEDMKVTADDGAVSEAEKEEAPLTESEEVPATPEPVEEEVASLKEGEELVEQAEEPVAPLKEQYGSSLVAADSGGKKCPACGYDLGMAEATECAEAATKEDEGMQVQESERPLEVSATEETASLTEAERVELLALRQDKMKRELLERATTAVKEAGIWMSPAELINFREAQWGSILKLAAGSTRSYGTGETDYAKFLESGETETAADNSPADLFEDAFARVTH